MTGFLDKVAEINGPGLEGLVLQLLKQLGKISLDELLTRRVKQN